MSGTDATERLTRDVVALARQQVQRLRGELVESGKQLGGGTVLLAGAGALGLMAAISAHQTVLRALEALVPRPLAAGILAAAYSSGGAALAVAGMERVRSAADTSSDLIKQAAAAVPAAGEAAASGEDA